MSYANTVPFYIGDLSMCRLWYLWRILEPITPWILRDGSLFRDHSKAFKKSNYSICMGRPKSTSYYLVSEYSPSNI